MTLSRRAFVSLLAAPALPVRALELPPALRPDMAAFAAQAVDRHGLDPARVESTLLDIRFLTAVLDAVARPGTARPWHAFRRDALTRTRIDGGARFWREHAHLLSRARETFAVPESVIVAILGIETVYGRHAGRFRVLDALGTLGFAGTNRTAFFLSELEALLLLDRDGQVDPREVRGSYAGAMGWPQFMPSSLRRYGHDFDGDGRVDLWRSPADITGSVANYLHAFGWRLGEEAAVPARIEDPAAAAALVALGVKPTLTAAELAARGVTPERPLPPDGRAALLLFDGETGPEYWLGLDNFYAITRYNRSQNYALSVWQLAGRIAAKRGPG